MTFDEFQRIGLDATVAQIHMQSIGERNWRIFIDRKFWVYYRVRTWTRTGTVALLLEDKALVVAVATTATIGAQHVCASTKVPVVIRRHSALHRIGAVAALDDVPVLGAIAKGLAGNRHVLVVRIIAAIGKNKQVVRSLIADSVARLSIRNHPIAVVRQLLLGGDAIDVRIDRMVRAQGEKTSQLGAGNAIDTILDGTISMNRQGKTCEKAYRKTNNEAMFHVSC